MIGAAEKLRFERICGDALRSERERAGIGTYAEKMLHSILKKFICEDSSSHEVKVYPDTPAPDGTRESLYVADVLCDCDIFEIQTGGLYPLRAKIEYYLEQTSYNVTVVVPLAALKRINWINPETSEAEKRSRSPKKQSALDLLPELYWMIPFLNNRRFRVRAILLEIEEFRLRDGWSKDGKRGSHRIERIPTALVDITDLSAPADYISILPQALPSPLSATDLAKSTGLRNRRPYSAIKVLLALGLLSPDAKRGRTQLYIKNY